MNRNHQKQPPAAAGRRLTDGEIQEFKQLVSAHSKATLSDTEARELSHQLLSILSTVRDVQLAEVRKREVAEVQAQSSDARLRELRLSLRRLQHELESVAQHPSNWRWAVIALHEALAQALELQLPNTGKDRPLPEQFHLVEQEHPELPQVQASIEMIDRLRTKHITAGVPSWPVSQAKLPGVVLDCLRVIERLESGLETEIRNAEGQLSD